MNKIKERCRECKTCGDSGYWPSYAGIPGEECPTCQGSKPAKTTLEERLELEVEVNRSKR